MIPLPPSGASEARIAEILVAIGAVRLTTGTPFIYTSGWASPVYVDTRLLMSHVPFRKEVMDLACARMTQLVAERGINAIVGAESTGIAFAAWLSERLGLPMLYLRKRPMGWGSSARLEGRLPDAPRLLYMDDVTTDGRSKVSAIHALRGTGAEADDILVLLDYAIYPRDITLGADGRLSLHALTHWTALFAALKAEGALSPEAARTLARFDADPVQWSLDNGGVGA